MNLGQGEECRHPAGYALKSSLTGKKRNPKPMRHEVPILKLILIFSLFIIGGVLGLVFFFVCYLACGVLCFNHHNCSRRESPTSAHLLHGPGPHLRWDPGA